MVGEKLTKNFFLILILLKLKNRLRTGDLFSMDKDGYLYFKSRIKDVIIRGGANIYPSEVETYLRTHPSVLDAQVFGVYNFQCIFLLYWLAFSCI